MRGTRTAPVLAIVASVLASALALAQSPAPSRIARDTLGGIETMAGSGYRLDSTLGQAAPGHSAGSGLAPAGALALDAGFWTPQQAAQPPGKPTFLYLTLVLKGYPPVIDLPDAPGQCASSYTIAPGTNYRESFGASNDNDWYQFTADAGVTYTIRAFNLGERADTVMGLYAPNCTTVLAENDDSGDPNDKGSRIVWVAPAVGFYHILVRNYDWRIYGEGTSYWLLAAKSSSPVASVQQLKTSKPVPPPTPVPGSQ